MQIGDEELNFTDEEARALGDIPVVPRGQHARRQDHALDHEFPVGMLLVVVAIALIVAAVASSRSHFTPVSKNTQTLEITQHPSQPEYFPAGWDYIKAANPTEMSNNGQLYTIPKDCVFFVSLRNIDGSHLAVAEDGSWNGWVKETGSERQIPMHPDFSGAKQFVRQIQWNLIESPDSPEEAPSQEAAKTNLEALRAFEAQTERTDMTLFQKKDQQETPEITVQGEEAIIPQPPDSVQSEKKVKLPKTKWYSDAEGGASAPSFSNWRWVCMSTGGLLCALQDAQGNYVQSFLLNGGSIRAGGIFAGAVRPQAWGCEVMQGNLYCTIQDGRGNILQGCSYDGKSMACGN